MTNRVFGALPAKKALRDHIKTNFPGYLDTWRSAAGIDPDDLVAPDQDAYFHNETQALDRWPMISISAPRVPSLRRMEQGEDGSATYETVYALRVFGWVRHEGWSETIDMRDNFMACLTNFLLDNQAITEYMFLDENTLSVENSDVAAGKGGRYIAGGYIAFNVRAEESVGRTPSGTVATTQADVHPIPIHPALE